jgi:hypothetical protein
MKLDNVTYTGPALDDPELLDQLPKGLVALLQQTNGYIQHGGGVHVRGACSAPAWHSLREAWLGAHAFHRLYPDMKPEDVPFAEDCLGDQFFLRAGEVWRLFAETGEVESLEVSFKEFMAEAANDPVESLGLEPLLQFQKDGGKLEPGQLLAAYPPFCTEEAEDGVTVSAMSSEERHRFLAEFAAKLRDLPDGEQLDIQVRD